MYREDAIETGPLGNIGEHRVRLTEKEAQLYLRTVLQLCAAGKLRCSEKTMRPSSATISIVVSHLAGGDFYLLDPIASFAWPLLVQAGGLANLESGRLQLTAKGRTALRKPPAEVIRALWQRWVAHAVSTSSAGSRRSRASAPAMFSARPDHAARRLPPRWPAARPASGSAWTPCSRPCDGGT